MKYIYNLKNADGIYIYWKFYNVYIHSKVPFSFRLNWFMHLLVGQLQTYSARKRQKVGTPFKFYKKSNGLQLQ